MKTTLHPRVLWLDNFRSLSVYMMILFHFTYDLTIFHLIELDMNQGFWFYFPRFIAGSFLFCVGASLEQSSLNDLNFKKMLPRLFKIGIGATLVSLLTWIFYKNYWIYFGTLHCIFFASLFGYFLIRKPLLQLILFLVITVLQWVFHYDVKWVSSLINRPSMDFIPIYPWMNWVLLGMLAGPLINKYYPTIGTMSRWWILPGQYSFSIYLIHQPLIIGILSLVKMLG
jgi:uncharacterized membrane protein